MRHVEKIFLLFSLFSSLDAFCQLPEQVEMADILRRDGKIYTVVLALVVILTAVIILLIRIDRKIFHLEKELKEKK